MTAQQTGQMRNGETRVGSIPAMPPAERQIKTQEGNMTKEQEKVLTDRLNYLYEMYTQFCEKEEEARRTRNIKKAGLLAQRAQALSNEISGISFTLHTLGYGDLMERFINAEEEGQNGKVQTSL